MAYTHELSQIRSATLRRLAWFRGKPMSKTLESLLEATGRMMAEIRPGEVWAKARDDSICEYCPFHLTQTNNHPIIYFKLKNQSIVGIIIMTCELKQVPGLIQKPTQIQKLILTTQLEQAMRLFQLSRFDLLETINNEI